MAAISVTLSSTTLAEGVDGRLSSVKVLSTSGFVPGTTCLYIDRELMAVTSIGLADSLGTLVNVRRGIGGTSASAHSGASPILFGRGDQFYQSDPVGQPPPEVLVSPWINVITGDRWVSQGDSLPGTSGTRWWAKNVNTHGVGPLGVRTNTYAPSKVTQA